MIITIADGDIETVLDTEGAGSVAIAKGSSAHVRFTFQEFHDIMTAIQRANIRSDRELAEYQAQGAMSRAQLGMAAAPADVYDGLGGYRPTLGNQH